MAKVKLNRGGMVMTMTVAPYGTSPQDPVLNARFAPMSKLERDEYLDAQTGKSPAAKLELLVTEIGRRIVSWDVDADPKKPADVKDLPPVFLDRIELHLTGYAASAEAAADEKKSEPPPA